MKNTNTQTSTPAHHTILSLIEHELTGNQDNAAEHRSQKHHSEGICATGQCSTTAKCLAKWHMARHSPSTPKGAFTTTSVTSGAPPVSSLPLKNLPPPFSPEGGETPSAHSPVQRLNVQPRVPVTLEDDSSSQARQLCAQSNAARCDQVQEGLLS